jgi:hypothetical protein
MMSALFPVIASRQRTSTSGALRLSTFSIASTSLSQHDLANTRRWLPDMRHAEGFQARDDGDCHMTGLIGFVVLADAAAYTLAHTYPLLRTGTRI